MGLRNKDRSFWKKLEDWEVIVLIKTWTEEKGCRKVLRMLPDGYVWKTQVARRRSKKERAMVGILILGIRKEIEKRKKRHTRSGRNNNR